MLKLIMAVSADGFVARGPDDPMLWTGSEDKRLFRTLTVVGGVVAVGRATAQHMPAYLPARTLLVLRSEARDGLTLERFAADHPGMWLAGGQTVALEALRLVLIDEVHLCLCQARLGSGIRNQVGPQMLPRLGWNHVQRGERHNVYRRADAAS